MPLNNIEKINRLNVSLIKDSDSELLKPYRKVFPIEEMPEKFNALISMLSNEAIYSREGIQELSEVIASQPDALGKDPFPLFHSFADSVYSREIHIPRGYCLVGAIHKHESMVYLISGKIIIVTEEGAELLEAPMRFTSKPGVKRIGFVIEDTVWIDLHSVESDTVEKAEKELFCESYEELEYANMVKELGFTEEQVSKLSQIDIDLIDTRKEYIGNTEVKESDIHGLGVFTLRDFKEGEVVDCLREHVYRAPPGRYTNHSDRPNVQCIIEGDRLLLIALIELPKNTEILSDYRENRSMALTLDDQLGLTGALCQQA